MPILTELQNRREFLRTSARNLTLTALALFSGAMAVRKHDPRDKHRCINEFICGDCRILPECILPQAMSLKAKDVPRS